MFLDFHPERMEPPGVLAGEQQGPRIRREIRGALGGVAR